MRPLVISHAACAGHAPENTLAGIRTALELGADAIEVDVQASADGVPVLMHDLTVDRTTNGSGDLASLTLEQLQALDTGGEPVPTFAQALGLTRGRGDRQGALLVAEIKRPGCEASLANVIRQADAERDVMVWSFLAAALTAMRQEEPRVPGCLHIPPGSIEHWSSLRDLALRLGLQGVGVFHPNLSAEVVASAARSGLAVYAWTADTESDIQRLLDLDVDGIVSDYPERVLSLLGRSGGRP